MFEQIINKQFRLKVKMRKKTQPMAETNLTKKLIRKRTVGCKRYIVKNKIDKLLAQLSLKTEKTSLKKNSTKTLFTLNDIKIKENIE